MDFAKMLEYLQTLLTNKQGMQGSQFNSNLGLQHDVLNQRDKQFQEQLALQRAQQEYAQRSGDRQFGLQDRMNVTPGSSQWTIMQMLQGMLSKPNTIPNRMSDNQQPSASPNRAWITPAGTGW